MTMTDHEMISNIHRRMDNQDTLLRDIRDKLIEQATRLDDHLEAEKEVKPALDELITIWRGSKLIFPILAGIAAGCWAIISWAKEHIKL